MSNFVGTEVGPDAVQMMNGRWTILSPKAYPGAMFAVTADFCGHCHNLKRSVGQAQRYKDIPFLFMDATRSSNARDKVLMMGIEGFPTIYKVGRAGRLEPYEGSRDPRTLIEAFGP